jgi:hypothetical protein
MNKQAFTSLCDRLETNVPALRWIDWDNGQLEAERPAVTYPCCLIDLIYPSCDDIAKQEQIADVEIVLRISFDHRGATNAATSAENRTTAMSVFDTIEDVHKQLQGWTNTWTLSPLSRKSAIREKRRNNKPVYRITYTTTLHDIPS